jgi:predicted amidohydrolase
VLASERARVLAEYVRRCAPFINATTRASSRTRAASAYASTARRTSRRLTCPGTGSYEKFYFSPGNEFPVFDLCGTKIGIQICYDRKYPEGSRLLALKGAEILFMPICAATYGETKLRGNTWELPLQARAYENGVYVVAVNRCGMEQGRNHIGRSMIVDPIGADMVAVASSDTPELLVATVDLDNVAAAQTSLPWWRDRRPELYGSLSTA